MIRDLFRPADGAEEDRVKAFELFEPVVRHHLAVLQVVIAAGPFEVFELQFQPVPCGSGLHHTYAFGQHFQADSVTGDGCNTQFLVVHGGVLSESIHYGCAMNELHRPSML